MISCIHWIPKNVADPNPKRYELSKAERELLAQEQNGELNAEEQPQDDDSDSDVDDNMNTNNEVEQVQVPKEGKKLTATEIIAAQKIDPSTLPKELRMDEYSDDEEETGNGNNGNNNDVGDILIGRDNDAGMMGIDEDGKVEDIDIEEDSEDDDDFEDIPDTREYAPTDVKGLEAMNFGGYTGMNEFEDGEDSDDDSDIEDTNLKPDDALLLVAKTEEVGSTFSILMMSFLHNYIYF